MRGWSLYQFPSSDSWDGALEIEAYIRASARSGRSTFDVEYLADRFHSATRTISDFTDWDGDGFWMITGLPDGIAGSVLLVFMVKQRRDDLLFIASELPMPWLDEWRCPKRTLPRESTLERTSALTAHIERVRAVVAEIVAERLRMN